MKEMSSMAILELVVNQKYYNQLVINRFHYVSSGTPASVSLSFGLVNAAGFVPDPPSATTFAEDTLADAFENIQVEALTYVSAYARDLFSVTDFYEIPYVNAITGDRTGSGMSPAVATGFYSNRVRTDIRRGMKRFAGLSETDCDAGGVLAAGFSASTTLMSNALGATLTYDDEGNTLTFVPAILGLEEYTTPSGKRAYRPYATQSAQLSHIAQGVTWAVYPQARTQVSRQYGRGV
jgi:hypothetical protein